MRAFAGNNGGTLCVRFCLLVRSPSLTLFFQYSSILAQEVLLNSLVTSNYDMDSFLLTVSVVSVRPVVFSQLPAIPSCSMCGTHKTALYFDAVLFFHMAQTAVLWIPFFVLHLLFSVLRNFSLFCPPSPSHFPLSAYIGSSQQLTVGHTWEKIKRERKKESVFLSSVSLIV